MHIVFQNVFSISAKKLYAFLCLVTIDCVKDFREDICISLRRFKYYSAFLGQGAHICVAARQSKFSQNQKVKHYNPMRILERVQPFFTSFEF